jgi:hypothetical protein
MQHGWVCVCSYVVQLTVSATAATSASAMSSGAGGASGASGAAGGSGGGTTSSSAGESLGSDLSHCFLFTERDKVSQFYVYVCACMYVCCFADPPFSCSSSVSPSVMVGSFQSAGMVGKMSAPTVSTSYRGFAGKMNLYNGNLGLYGSSASSNSTASSETSGGDQFESDPGDGGGSARKMAGADTSRAAFYIGDGRPPENFFRETVIVFATLIGLLLLFSLAQYWYYRRINHHSNKKILHLGWVSNFRFLFFFLQFAC